MAFRQRTVLFSRSGTLNRSEEPSVCHPPEMMLRGYAIECLLKGRWLRQGKHLYDDNGRYERIPNAGDHDLIQLADAVGVVLTAEQRDVLQRVTQYVKTWGRYPLPRNVSEARVTVWTSEHERVLEQFVAELTASLRPFQEDQ